jgi:hypothetical protein
MVGEVVDFQCQAVAEVVVDYHCHHLAAEQVVALAEAVL